ncbi:MAG: hypothetical protein MZV70_53225 [Desulfobacterales bacterium]|nr:hypothetical protein [Desulfobacterales bacterium]
MLDSRHLSWASVPVLQLLKQIQWTGTLVRLGLIVHDLGRGERKLVGTFYDIYVWDRQFNLLDKGPSGSSYPHEGRIYAPAVCADLDGDGIYEIVAGSNNGKVTVKEWKNDRRLVKRGWPVSTLQRRSVPRGAGTCRRGPHRRRLHRSRGHHHAR